jgi:HD-GYP domain-containing protein (c-di-GMP phosphodiesterase class II)
MTEEQKKLFYTHPMKGAELLRGLRSLEEAALQAIEQHHMRLGGRGFPNAARAGTVGRVAEIVGICEEFNRLILAHPDFTRAQLLEQLEKLVFPGFSRQILYAFRSLFFPRPSG